VRIEEDTPFRMNSQPAFLPVTADHHQKFTWERDSRHLNYFPSTYWTANTRWSLTPSYSILMSFTGILIFQPAYSSRECRRGTGPMGWFSPDLM
jgi:hypothetical protein